MTRFAAVRPADPKAQIPMPDGSGQRLPAEGRTVDLWAHDYFWQHALDDGSVEMAEPDLPKPKSDLISKMSSRPAAKTPEE